MTDEQKTQIDRILEDCKIPVGQENGFIGNVLQTRVAYGTLTEYQRNGSSTLIDSITTRLRSSQ